jgi:nicotinate-nucleotide adenylyltransferase
VGLFGGSFDPVHLAHLALAHEALRVLALDEVRWMPVGQAWQKTRPLTAAEHRVAMLRQALAGEPRFVLDTLETERPGPSFTIDTVRALQARQPHSEWFLLLGQDQFAGFHSWQHWQELLTLVVLAVAKRPGAPVSAPNSAHPAVTASPYRVVPMPLMAVSATDIRARVAAGQSISSLVPTEVARYIETHGLYRSPSTP